MLIIKLPKLVQLTLAVLLPLLAALVQWQLGSLLPAISWALFYQAVFLAALVGGFPSGLLAIGVAILLNLFIFILPQWTHSDVSGQGYFTMSLFTVMSVMFSLLLDRLRQSALELDRIQTLKLESNQHRLTMTLLVAQAGVWEWDQHSHMTWSESLWNLFGLESAGNIASYDLWLSTVHPEQKTLLIDKLNTALENGTEAHLEWRCAQLFNGKPRWLMSRGHPAEFEGQGYCGIVVDITQRKESELAAEYARQQYQILFDQAAPDAMFVHDDNGHFVKVNTQACVSVGYSAEELLTMNVIDLEVDFDLATAQTEWAKIKVGKRKILSGHHRHKDGHLFPVEVHFGLTEFDGRRLYLGIVRDITQQQELFNTIKNKEARLQAFLDNSLTIAWIKDAQGGYQYISPNFEKRFFKSPLEWLGKTDFDLWPEASARQFYNNDQHVLNTRQPFEIIEQVQESDGIISSWQNCKFPFQDNQGNWFVGGMGVDITLRIQQEAELAKYRDRLLLQYRHLLAATNDGYLLASKTGKIEDVNEAYVQLSGYNRDELMTLSLSDLEALETPEQIQVHLTEIIFNENGLFETQHRAKNGQLLDVEVNVNFQTLTDKFVILIRDIRVRKVHLQAEILARKESEQHLQRAIKAEQELLKVYEKTSREFGRELHDDLGQQLTALALLSEVLNQDLLQENSQLCKSSQKITDRLNLAVSRVRQLSHALCPVSSDYNSLIDMLNMLVGQSSGLQDLSCCFYYDPDLSRNYFDYARLPAEEFNIQLFRIAQEAINNAIKHSQGTQIDLSLRAGDNGDIFEISDNGIGLSANHTPGLGINSMTFRSNMLKADMTFRNNDQGGLSVSIYLPRSGNQDGTL